MRRVFADTGYWCVLLNRQDALHQEAYSASRSLGAVQLVTSEMVLSELLNHFAEKGATLRRAALLASRALRARPDVEIVPQTSDQFTEALREYEQVQDKSWSLTDCASFQIMRRLGITDALTHDRHFVQAGFVALLRKG